MSNPKPLIDPEWSAKFSRDLERMVAAAQRDAKRTGERIGLALESFARRIEK